MPDLSHLKIKEAPEAFVAFASQHNALVDLISSMSGALGVDVLIASSPRQKGNFPRGMKHPKQQPRGRILVTANPTSLSPYTGTGAAATGNTTQTVGIDGLLLDVLQPASANAAATYPSTLRAGNGTPYTIANATGFRVQGNTNSVAITYASITKDIAPRVISVCDNGAAKSMLILGSAPY